MKKTESPISSILITQKFEQMRNMAELKALSAFSLEQPLTTEQFKRMKELFELTRED